MKVLNKQDGQVLLYALLVISFITAIAITISIIVVNELRLTTAATDATVAFYGAESGVERGLYAVRVARESGTETVASTLARIRSQNDDLDSDAAYDNSGTDTTSSFIEHETVRENRYVQADYYNAVNPLLDSTVRSVEILNEGGDPASWAEVSWTAWDELGQIGASEETRVAIGPSDLEPNPITGRGWIIPRLDVFTALDPVGYRMRIKAFKALPSSSETGDLSDLSVIPFDAENGQGNRVTDLPSEIAVNSIGQLSSFKQSLTATVPWKVPLAGLYDYVLYSEGEIVKDIILNQQTYASGAIQVEASLTSSCLGTCNPYVDGNCCTLCQNNGWSGLECISPAIYPFGNIECDENGGWCRLMVALPAGPVYWDNYWGFTLPIPDTIPEGDEYYVSLRTFYDDNNCRDLNGDGSCDRDLSVEISGQSIVVGEPIGSDGNWVTCTIPESFSLGDPSSLPSDPSRTITITTHPFPPDSNQGTDGWADDVGPPPISESVMIDWYQISTYKIFPDCSL